MKKNIVDFLDKSLETFLSVRFVYTVVNTERKNDVIVLLEKLLIDYYKGLCPYRYIVPSS